METMPETVPATKSKLSLASSVGYRPGQERREWFERLRAETGLKISDIVRLAVETFAPEVEAMARGVQRSSALGDPAQLRETLELIREIRDLGFNPADVIGQALRDAITADAAQLAREEEPAEDAA